MPMAMFEASAMGRRQAATKTQRHSPAAQQGTQPKPTDLGSGAVDWGGAAKEGVLAMAGAGWWRASAKIYLLEVGVGGR